MLAKKLAIDKAKRSLEIEDEHHLNQFKDDALPLDNLDNNIWNKDALFTDWPEVDAIVGNPPYQSKNKIQKEYGIQYLHDLRARHPKVSEGASNSRPSAKSRSHVCTANAA